mmetsp:Transcript_6286/g.13892  ORF Transcript_6286/g.13892 Transcript_6286/m.13892 type:complete len:214 (+) Transcript_6286:436-1077(+)
MMPMTTRMMTQMQHCLARMLFCSSMLSTSSLLPESTYSPASFTWCSIWSSSSPCCSVSSAKSRNIWCSSATEASNVNTSWYLSATFMYAFCTDSAASPERIADFSTSPDPPPDLKTASISSLVASGLTICTCLLTFFLMSVLYFVCAFWYSFITSTNFLVSVLARFSLMRISGVILAPSLEVFMRSVSSRSLCSSCLAREAFLFVFFTMGSSS